MFVSIWNYASSLSPVLTNTICYGELSYPLSDSLNRGLTLVRMHESRSFKKMVAWRHLSNNTAKPNKDRLEIQDFSYFTTAIVHFLCNIQYIKVLSLYLKFRNISKQYSEFFYFKKLCTHIYCILLSYKSKLLWFVGSNVYDNGIMGNKVIFLIACACAFLAIWKIWWGTLYYSILN